MGWTIPYNTPHRHTLIADRAKVHEFTNKEDSVVKWVPLKHCYIGGQRKGTLYIVWEITMTAKDGTITTSRFIGVELLEYYAAQNSWGYKDMECCIGPDKSMCPPAYLDLCPPHESQGNTWCADWHARCRTYWADRKAKRQKTVAA